MKLQIHLKITGHAYGNANEFKQNFSGRTNTFFFKSSVKTYLTEELDSL